MADVLTEALIEITNDIVAMMQEQGEELNKNIDTLNEHLLEIENKIDMILKL